MPLRSTVLLFGRWPFDFRCDLPLELNKLSAQASVLHLVAIAIDRYLIVSKIQRSNPLSDMKNKLRIAVMLALVWFIPALYVSLPYFGWHDKGWKSRNDDHKCVGVRLVGYRVLGLLITFYIPISVIILFYYFIYQIAGESSRLKRNYNKEIFRLSDRKSTLEWDPTEYHSQTGDHRSANGQRLSILKRLMQNKDRETKVAKTLWIITSVFLLCWSPFMITYTLFLTEDIASIHVMLNEAVIWSGLCNSAVNPIIYAYFVPTFRSTFKKIVFRK